MPRRNMIFYRRGAVERPCTRHGKPSYRWAQGWSRNSAEGHALYPWQTRREAQAEARAAGAIAVFLEPAPPAAGRSVLVPSCYP